MYTDPTQKIDTVEPSKFPEGASITGVWLYRDGEEDDPNAEAVVYAEIDGHWWELIREPLSACFSHMASPRAIRADAHPKWESYGGSE